MAHRLDTVISDALWQVLHERATSSGQTIRALVQAALAESLGVAHHSMFQISTSGALVEGLYQGAITVGDLRQHGDTGLGTFEELDGEMILVDGHCYQARSDVNVTEASDEALTPFATVVAFVADETHEFHDVVSFADLTSRLDSLRSSNNEFIAWRITGHLDTLRVRTACRHVSGTPLSEAVADQAVFDVVDMPATIVGFWSPAYAPSVAIPGYHLHAISDDRAHAGHLFDLTGRHLVVELHRVKDIHVALPSTEAFLQAHLSPDSGSAMGSVERPT